MGSGGTEWDGSDTPSSARLNQKTVFVGTGVQIAAVTTFAGMQAYCTSTGSGFTIDHLYVRNAVNGAWVDFQTVNTVLTETAEQNNTPVSDNADFTATAGTRYYAFFTLPSTEKFYLVVGVEWKNGATVAGNVTAGVDVVDANPPTLAGTPLRVLTQEVAQAGVSVVQRISILSTEQLRAGDICGAWVSCSSASATLREQTGMGSQNQQKATSYSASPGTQDTAAWTTATARKYLKVYFRGYS